MLRHFSDAICSRVDRELNHTLMPVKSSFFLHQLFVSFLVLILAGSGSGSDRRSFLRGEDSDSAKDSSDYFIDFRIDQRSLSEGNGSYALTALKDYGPKTLEKVRWLHFPRTGSGFASTILHYACDEGLIDARGNFEMKRKQPWTYNEECNEKILGKTNFYKTTPLLYEENKFTAAMFRNPVDRFASQLRWMRSMVRFVVSYGVAEEDVPALLGALNIVPKVKTMNTSNPCYYASKKIGTLRSCRYVLASHFPGLRGCMTKMVLGKQCSEKYQLTHADLAEAKRIVREELAFVGLTERWQESIRLFHSMHGGTLYSEELFIRTRESPPAIENVRSALGSSYDYFDEELYRTAVETFDLQKEMVEDRIRATGVDLI